MDTITSEKMTANLDTDLDEKARETVGALGRYDLVYLHLKGCDIAGHDQNPEAKRDFISRTDEILGKIVNRTASFRDLYVVLAADHATPAEQGEHSGDPVPILINGPSVEPDGVQSYGESFCKEGSLGRLLCKEFLNQLFSHLQTKPVKQA
jgi:2,3-bisphosphoglycerate-independent phosphoglycerate mutase